MKQIYRVDKSGNLAQAISEITAPKLLLLMSNNEQFEQHVEELERYFPGVPSIGCIGGSYGGQTVVADNGVAVIAMEGNLSVVTNVLEQASTMPVKYIGRLEEDINKVAASQNNTICIDFCSGNDACVLTTIYSVLGKKHISLVGGTGDGGKVSVNGKIYADADAYALIRNNDGKIKVYKENIYKQVPACRFIASKTDRSKYLIGELNGRPARKVYQDILNIGDKEMATQTFKNPLGKMNGQDICIISIKEVVGDKLECYRQVNDSDVLTLLELQDISHVVENTINQIKKDFTH
ncbi:MAG: FIST N-terminal domain-containing protein, partial [Lachnospira pectinoschiza]